jgi:hypothetical protein
MTRSELESWVIEDYQKILGETIFVSDLTGYVDDNTVDFGLKKPAKVKVVKTSMDSLLHWNDEWLDPYWELELVEPHPALKGVRSLWMFGDSYSLDGKCGPARYEPRQGPLEWSPRKPKKGRRK